MKPEIIRAPVSSINAKSKMLRITIRTIPITELTMCGTKSAGLPFAAPMTSKMEMIRPIMLKTRDEMIMPLATRKLRQ